MDKRLNIVHLFNSFRGSRYPTMISQGLRAHPHIHAHYLMPVVMLGSIVHPAEEHLENALQDADDEHFGFAEVDALLDRHGLCSKAVSLDLKSNPTVERTWSAARAELQGVVGGSNTVDNLPIDLIVAYARGHSVRAQSDYRTTITRWQSVLGDRQLLLLNYDDLTKDQVASLREILRFVGVDDQIDIDDVPLHQPKPSVRSPVIPERIGEVLTDVYRRRILELQQLLGWNLEHRLDPSLTLPHSVSIQP